MLKSRYFPVILAFIIVVCGTGYILSPNGSQALQGGIQQSIRYLPFYIIALVIGLAAGFIFSLLGGKQRSDRIFANGSLITFLIVALLGVFKDGWIHDNTHGWLSRGQETISHWLGHTTTPARTPSQPHRTQEHPRPPTTSTPHPQPHRETKTPSHTTSSTQQVISWTHTIAQQLPKKLDQYTQLSSVRYDQTHNTEIMRYDVDGFDSLGVDENQFVSSMRSNMLKLYCHGTFFNTLLSHRTGIYAAYHYHYGGVIGNPIVLNPTDCR